MSAHGSGAVALSESLGSVMNIDIGGGTTKVVTCRDGRTDELMAMDIGARLVACDASGRLIRLEPAALEIADRLDFELSPGALVSPEALSRIARYLVDHLLQEVRAHGSSANSHLLRTAPLSDRRVAAITFSGGVSEYIFGRSEQSFGDLGPAIAAELRRRSRELGAPVRELPGGIRATVIGASQYTIQISGSTIYLSPLDTVPIRDVPVVMPHFPWHEEEFSSRVFSDVIRDALRRFDLLDASVPVALAAQWEGSATYSRLKAFCSGAVEAMQPHFDKGHPLIMVFNSDIGGLVGLHFREEMRLDLPIISIDGVELREFDYVDIGALLPSSGAVPVVIKSLVFPRIDGV